MTSLKLADMKTRAHAAQLPSFIEIFDTIAADWVKSLGLKKQYDSSQQAFSADMNHNQRIMYVNGLNYLEVSQLCWRDDYTIFYAEFNRKELTSVDTSLFPNNEAAAKALFTTAREKLPLGI